MQAGPSERHDQTQVSGANKEGGHQVSHWRRRGGYQGPLAEEGGPEVNSYWEAGVLSTLYDQRRCAVA